MTAVKQVDGAEVAKHTDREKVRAEDFVKLIVALIAGRLDRCPRYVYNYGWAVAYR